MRFTLLLSLFRLASIFSRSPDFVQRSSVGWMVVRRPSVAVFALTRSSIELTLASPIGQPKEKPGFSKPFLAAQPAASAATSSAMMVHVRFILKSPLCGAAVLTFPACHQLTLRVRLGHPSIAGRPQGSPLPGTAQKAYCAADVSLPRHS